MLKGGLEVLQSQLDTHYKSLKEVNSSLKSLGDRRSYEPIKDTSDLILNPDVPELTREISRDFPSRKRDSIIGSAHNNGNGQITTPSKRRHDDDDSYRSTKINRTVHYGGRHDNDVSDDEENSRRKPTLQSSVVSAQMPIKTKEDLIKLQNKDSGSEKRNKRIFGMILGTLKQFKKEDKDLSSTTQAIHRKELETKLEVQKIEEKVKTVEERKRLHQEKVQNEQKIKKLEMKIGKLKDFEFWEKCQLPLKNSIRTKATPCIHYCPKVLDPTTEKLLSETAAIITDQIEKRHIEIQNEIDALESDDDETINNKENNKKKQLLLKKEGVDVDSENEMDDNPTNNINVGLSDDEEDEPATKESNAENGNVPSSIVVVKREMKDAKLAEAELVKGEKKDVDVDMIEPDEPSIE